MQFDRGYLSAYFITDSDKMECVMENPYAILAAPEGDSCKGHFSINRFSIANLEFRVHLDHERMYPTQSAVNLQNVGEAHVSDSQFCLDDNVGDTVLGKELQPNPCHTVGLMMSDDELKEIIRYGVDIFFNMETYL